jgi:hypothetical protein
MKTAKERVQFAIDFAQQKDLTRLTETQRRRLLSDLYQFLTGKPPSKGLMHLEYQFKLWEPEGLTPFTLAATQGQVKYLLHAIAMENWRAKHPGIQPWPDEVLGAAAETPMTSKRAGVFRLPDAQQDGSYWVDISLETGASARVPLLGPNRGRVQILRSRLADAVLLALSDALSEITVTYVRKCPGCEKVFIADDDRQTYCSSRCALKMRARRRRARRAAGTYQWDPAPGAPGFDWRTPEQQEVFLRAKRKQPKAARDQAF